MSGGPEVRISLMRAWSVDCDACGVIDDGLFKPEARELAEKHRKRHCDECGWLLPNHLDNCTQKEGRTAWSERDYCRGYHTRDVRAKWCAIATAFAGGCHHYCGSHIKLVSGRRYYDIHLLTECANGEHDCEKGYNDSHNPTRSAHD